MNNRQRHTIYRLFFAATFALLCWWAFCIVLQRILNWGF